MQQLTSIVAANHEGVIGVRNGLPWRLRSDLRFFKQTTLANTVIMGRKTYDSLGRRCLPDRHNIVLMRGFEMFSSTPDCRAAGSIEEGLAAAAEGSKRRKAYVIGGASMYEQFAPYVDRYLFTLVDKDVADGDTRFPVIGLGDPEEWDLVSVSHHPACQPDDEVSFHIFEWVSKRQSEIRRIRNELIQDTRRNPSKPRRISQGAKSPLEGPVYASML